MISISRTLEQYKNRQCWGGVDLGSVNDFTAWAMLFENTADPEILDIICRFWCPEARLYAQDNKYRDTYQAWARDGWLTTTEGDAVDYDMICDQITADCSVVMLDSINVDALFQGAHMIIRLNEVIGGSEKNPKVMPMRMGFLSFAAPMKKFEEKLLKKQLNHGGNPILRFCADNVGVRRDAMDNLKPDKAQSQGKIDGIVAVLMALDRYCRKPQGAMFKPIFF